MDEEDDSAAAHEFLLLKFGTVDWIFPIEDDNGEGGQDNGDEVLIR